MEARFEDCTLFDSQGGFCGDHLVITFKSPNAVASWAPIVNLRTCKRCTKCFSTKL
jgi:hypothetical protein